MRNLFWLRAWTKEDNEKFFRRLRLKAHFDEDSTEVQGESESPVGNITSNNPTNPRPDDELTSNQSDGSASATDLPSTYWLQTI